MMLPRIFYRVVLYILLELTVPRGIMGSKYDSNSANLCSLGLLSNKTLVPDSAFTESSAVSEYYNGKSIRSEDENFAWCTKKHISTGLMEWIQVDLGSLHVIKTLVTKGRSAQGSGKEYVPFYQIQYKREENENWVTYKKRNKEWLLLGNKDSVMEELQEMNPPFVARWIRVLPYSKTPLKVCLKMRIFGCKYQDTLVEYRLQQSSSMTKKYPQYMDSTYDGHTDNQGWLVNGLGKLADNETSASDKSINPTSDESDQFVGWRRGDQPNGGPAIVVFRFNSVRSFNSIRLLVSNAFNSDVRVFRRIELRFSVAGIRFDVQRPVVLDMKRDERIQAARWFNVSLGRRFGRYVEARMVFDDDWILISEVTFNSVPVSLKVSPEPPYTMTTKAVLQAVTPEPPYSNNPKNRGQSNGISSLGIVLLSLLCFLLAALIIGVLIKLCCYRHRHNRGTHIPDSRPDHRQFRPPMQMVKTSDGMLQIDLSDPSQPTMSINGKIVNDSTLYTSLPGSDTDSTCHMPPPPPPPLSIPISYGDTLPYSAAMPNSHHRALPIPNLGNQEYASATLVKSGMQHRPVPNPPQITCNPMLDYLDLQQQQQQQPPPPHMQHYMHHGTLVGTMLPPGHPHYQMMLQHTLGRGVYGGMQQSTYLPLQIVIQGMTGNSVYSAPRDLDLSSADRTMPRVERSRIAFLEKLGGGHFGEVHLAELKPGDLSTENGGNNTDGTDSGKEDISLTNGDSNSDTQESTLVLVKMLRKDAPEQAKRDFEQELRVLSRLSNPFVSCLVGVCREEGGGPLTALLEYTRYGDLHQFLQGHYSAEVCTTLHPLPPNTRTLSYGALIYMAVQVASGMAYLESIQLVHRDLASRNCLVGSFYSIKITDCAMCRRLYSTDYLRVEGRALLPVRWLAWESLLQGEFSSKSDVWAFAVTLWEILTFCREQPFHNLTDEQVLFNASLLAADDRRAQRLPPPSCCPKETFDLMLSCWQRNDQSRPSFREIHMFLERKNLGYNPRQEPALHNSSGTTTVGGSLAQVNNNISSNSPLSS